MSGPSNDWIIIFAFFAGFVVVTVCDVYWLGKHLGIPIKKALLTVFLPNFVTITLGFLVSFIIFGILLATAWDENTEMPGGEAGTWAAFLTALAFPALLMAAIKRVLVKGLRITEIPQPTLYVVISTLIFFAAAFGIPAIFLAFR